MHAKTLSLLTAFLLSSLVGGTSPNNGSAEGRLASYITTKNDYVKEVIAAFGPPLEFTVTFYPILILSLEEKTQTFLTSAKFVIRWKDGRVTWDPSDYADILQVQVGMRNLWRPDFVIENVVGTSSFYIGSDDDVVEMTHGGDMVWSPTGSFQTICKVDVVRFPFDAQACRIELTTWMADSSNVHLKLSDPPVNYHAFIESGEWDLAAIESAFRVVHEPEASGNYSFQRLEYTYHLKRRSSFYVMSILLPVLLLSLMNALVFLLPAESGERLSMSVTSMLSLTIFLGNIGDMTPSNTEHVPHLAVFVLLNLIIGAVSTLLNIAVLNAHFSLKAGEGDADAKGEADAEDACSNENCGPGSSTASLRTLVAGHVLRPGVNAVSVAPSSAPDSPGQGSKTRACVLGCPAVPGTVTLLDKAFFTVMILSTCTGSLACLLAMLV